jgi:hypothetical protein
VKAIKLHGDAYSSPARRTLLVIDWRRAGSVPRGSRVKRFPGNTPTASTAEADGSVDRGRGPSQVCVHSLDEVKELLRAHGIDLDG